MFIPLLINSNAENCLTYQEQRLQLSITWDSAKTHGSTACQNRTYLRFHILVGSGAVRNRAQILWQKANRRVNCYRCRYVICQYRRRQRECVRNGKCQGRSINKYPPCSYVLYLLYEWRVVGNLRG